MKTEHTITKLKQLREAKGLSASELARALDMPNSSYRDYEQGLVKHPNPDRVTAIKNYWGNRISLKAVIEAVSCNRH